MLFQTLNSGSGDTAWLLAATCLVFIMTPGLAMFYGGLLRKKNVISMFGLCLSAAFIVSVVWWAIGYSIAFGPDTFGGLVGSLSFIGLVNPDWINATSGTTPNLPLAAYIAFECMFAVITAAILASPFTD